MWVHQAYLTWEKESKENISNLTMLRIGEGIKRERTWISLNL